MKRIEKDFSELDTSKVDFKGNDWTFSCGGYPSEDHDWAISHIADDEDMTETRYKLPKCLNEMVRTISRWGREEAEKTMRRALGL
jgi:hypothetical protein